MENSYFPAKNIGALNIPMPYRIVDGALYKLETRVKGGQEIEHKIMISRIAPIILSELSNLERAQIYFEIAWKNRGILVRELVPAGAIATKKDMMILADKGFPVNDNNYRLLIDYFDKILANNMIEKRVIVDRLGQVKENFVHPLLPVNFEIFTSDQGEKQILDAFKVCGTVKGWVDNVLEPIKQHPRALFMVLSSFASVLLHDLKIDPFIVDLASTTSQGKTTVLKVASSIWGTSQLVNEFNVTKTSVERKAAFLNSFPLIMDDTRKADERILESIVYQFSGGRSKGRSSLQGSQRELTWKNIMLTTGEVSLNTYSNKAGAAARIISLSKSPFEGVDYKFFTKLYKALEDYHGAVGLEFVNLYQERKKEVLPNFQQIRDFYMEKSHGNEVLTRLSLYYAAVHFTGVLLMELLDVDVNLKSVELLFDEIIQENLAIDKPKQLLEEILLKLDSSRKDIFYSYQPNNMKAIYKFETICLTPAFLKDFLGFEERFIRRQWMERGLTSTTTRDGKVVDYQTVKHQGKTFKVVCINKEIIEGFGLDFSEES